MKNKRPTPTRLYHTLWSNCIYSCALADKFATKQQKIIMFQVHGTTHSYCVTLHTYKSNFPEKFGTHWYTLVHIWYTFGTHQQATCSQHKIRIFYIPNRQCAPIRALRAGAVPTHHWGWAMAVGACGGRCMRPQTPKRIIFGVWLVVCTCNLAVICNNSNFMSDGRVYRSDYHHRNQWRPYEE